MREPIAIIGIGCRFPGGAKDLDSFWEVLKNGTDTISEVPPDRYDINTYYASTPEAPGKVVSREGGFLDQIDGFDAAFFNISPREAHYMDPQQRLLLEVTWEALEAASQTPEKLAGSRTGVFIGMWTNEYEARMHSALRDINLYVTTGGGRYSASGRLSYIFNLLGPSMTVDTACSSSLVAAHLACRSIWEGESEMAVVGGSNLILMPDITIGYSRSGMLSPEGRCKFGDVGANGYVRSEGVGVVILKSLAKALADGDPVHALIRGSAVNNDGRASASLVAPSPETQAMMLREAYANAGVDPRLVRYIEAHGTGTRVGDPVELKALGLILGENRPDDEPCYVGSVKTNIGHTEAASGIAGLIKAVLCLKHQMIPRSLHFETPNPGIPWGELPFIIPQTLTPWPEISGPAVAGVNSFGVTGTNAHVVLEEAPERTHITPPQAETYLLPLSARMPEALPELAHDYTLTAAQTTLHDLCYTASLRRTHHPYRMATVVHSTDELVEGLQAYSHGEIRGRFVVGSPDAPPVEPRVVFIFPGQGGQWLGMGRGLYAQEPAFRDSLERCAAAMRPYIEWDLLGELLNADEADSRFNEIDVIQPLLFAIEVALAELWQAWGVTPDAVIGHSMGEVAAAYIAGILSLDDAASVICRRSQLMKRVSGIGAMVMVELSVEEAEVALTGYADRVGVAVTNGPRSCVLSGDPAALDEIVATLQSRDVFCRRVNVDVAAHSPHMDALRPELVDALAGLTAHPAVMPVYSTVTGALQDGEAFNAAYWGANLRQLVRFAPAVQGALANGYNTFIEISPHPVLLPAIERGLRDYDLDADTVATVTTLASTKRDDYERLQMLESLGTLYVHGYAVDWARLYPAGGNNVPLPTYPWQRERYWYEADTVSRPKQRRELRGGHPLLGQHWRSAVHAGAHFWENEIDITALPYLVDHRVKGHVVLPAAAFGEMALAALAQIGEGGQLEILSIQEALFLGETETRTIQVVLTPDMSETYTFRCLSRPADDSNHEWTLHASGTARLASPDQPETVSWAALESSCQTFVSGTAYDEAMQGRGLNYGVQFQIATGFRHDDARHEGFAEFRLPEAVSSQAGDYQLHPALLDACLQLLVALLPPAADTYLPVRIERLCRYAPVDVNSELWGYARCSSFKGDESVGDVFLLNAAGKVIAAVYGLHLQRVERAEGGDALDQLVYSVVWEEKPLAGGVLPKPDSPGSWLILSNSDLAVELVGRLGAKGEHSMIVSAGVNYRQLDAGHYTINPANAPDFAQLLAETTRAGLPPYRGIVYLWGLESGEQVGNEAEALHLAETHGCIGALHLVQALAGLETLPRLWLVTRGTQPVDGLVTAAEGAALWGLGAVIANEHPELHVVRVDTDGQTVTETVDTLFREFWLNDGEDQIGLRGDRRYVARLAHGLPDPPAAATGIVREITTDEQSFRAAVSTPGILDNLELRAMPRHQPGTVEVEIEVHATGLNFMNVLSAMGTYPGYPDGVGPLGIECAGVISAIGEGVDDFEVGDAVIAIAFDSLASHALANAHLVTHKPKHLSFVEAASIPIVFLTAYYGLLHQARLEAGERVLIHAAAGGVGLAAVQLAQLAGAEIYATAGSPAKRAFLESLGIEHIMDSRSLAFADVIMEVTGGEGVDVILNSLAGEAIPRGLAILRPYGRFVEIGKRDIYQNSQVGLMPFQKNLSYFAVDLDKMARERPAALGAMLRSLVERFENGELAPIPTEVFSTAQVAEAFRHMAQAKHIGKIVIARTDEPLLVNFEDENVTPVHGDGTYLITGGLGALGLEVARWLVEQGADHLVLTGRRGASESAQAVIRELESVGTVVYVVQADVADADDIAALLRTLDTTMPLLRGVVHAAGVLDDSLLAQMNRDQFRRALAPKMAGAWNLHVLTQDYALDFFVMFSSVTALLGTPGQGNYAAGNAFMDVLAYYRRGQGLPALSINWGPWSGVGLAAADAIRGERLAARGLGSLSPDEGMAIFHRLMTQDTPPQAAVMAFDVSAWTQAYPASAQTSLLAGLRQVLETESSGHKPEQASGDLRQALLGIEPGRQRRTLLEIHIREQVAQVLRIPTARIGLQQPLRELGIDSLLTLELRNRLEATMKLTLSATLIFNYPTVAALTGHLADKLAIPLDAQATGEAEPQAVAQPVTSELDDLSRDEIEALLAEELKSIDDLLKGTNGDE